MYKITTLLVNLGPKTIKAQQLHTHLSEAYFDVCVLPSHSEYQLAHAASDI